MSNQTKVTEADCAYLAAWIDNSAQVTIHRETRRGKVYRRLLMKLVGLPASVAEWFVEKFGTAIRFSRPQGTEITYVSRRAAEICVHAYPYLIANKHVARLVTRFASSLGANRTPTSPENEEIRASVDRELQRIEKSRGGHR